MSGKIIALVLLATVLAACGAGARAAPTAAPAGLEGTAWVLQLLRGQPLVAGSTITLEFESGQLGGSAGCNSYGAPYEARDGKLTLGQVVMTEMYCTGSAGVMEQESQYLDLLQHVTSLELGAGQLTLHTADGSALVFRTP